MCGISVICNPHSWQHHHSSAPKSYTQIAVEDIEKSLELIKHRGPDDRGTWISSDGRVGLGHVRLSIIDLPGGHQPLTNEAETVHCVVAGELYDYKQIRLELEAKGTKFKTHSDSEILLGLYEHYGVDLLRHLRGEFTFALYDTTRSLLLVARDRFGIKPLYYTFSEGRLLIANEMKAFLGFGWKAKWDVESILQVGEFGDDRTCFQGVRKLPPGHYITYDRSDRLKVLPYWDQIYPSQNPTNFPKNPSPNSVDEAITTVRELLIDAVRTRLRSDVPLAFYLSGGIDSSSVAGIAAMLLKQENPNAQLHTFTLGSPDRAEVDEGPRARRLAEHIGATMHMVEPTEQELIDEFETTVYHTENPVNQLLAPGKAILSKAVRKAGFKVVLSGEGSDETFAGYNFVMSDFLCQPDHLAAHMFNIPLPTDSERASVLKEIQSRPRQDLVSLKDLSFSPQPIYAAMLGGLMPPLVSVMALPDDFFRESVLERYGPSDVYNTTAEYVPTLLRNRLASGDCHGLHGALYMANKTVMGNLILNHVGDRTEMVNSIEGRPPFLDHKLVEYANSLPPSIKIRPQLVSTNGDTSINSDSQVNGGPHLNGTTSNQTPIRKWNFTEKWVLREAVRPFVTEEIYHAKKSQYNISVAKTTSSLTTALTPLQSYFKRRVQKEDIEKVGLFSWDRVEECLREFLEQPESPVDGGLDRNGRRLLYVMSFVVLQERFGM